MADRFNKQVPTLDSPLGDAFVISANDSTVFTQPTRAVYVGAGGDLKVTMAGQTGNTTLVFSNVPSGALLPIRVSAVFSSNTTANNIIGLF